jgi:hypothetical protein
VADLSLLLTEIDRHAAARGWDQPTRLYALVDTAGLLEREPQLRGEVAEAEPGMLTPIEQEPVEGDLAELLAGIEWPGEVSGCAAVTEVLMLPGGTQPPDGVDVEDFVAAHPGRREVRIVAAVLRDGSRDSLLRFRARDGEDGDEVLRGPDLVANLCAALADTLT